MGVWWGGRRTWGCFCAVPHVCARVCPFLCVCDRGCAPGALIQLAFKTLINCCGICLFSVNAISHAECSVNGCVPTAGPAPTSSPLFSSPLLFYLSSLRLIKGLLRLFNRNGQEWNDATLLRRPDSWRRLNVPTRKTQSHHLNSDSLKVGPASSSPPFL